jgi:acyl-CoA synthetase (AMP-forming)/AMP-acid ligase II
MAVQRAVAERWKQITGVTLIEAYGLTETSPAATINPLDLKEYNGCIGLPISSTEVAIRDDDGKDLPIGEAGELCIRGPQVMKGYWNRPEETAKVIMADGFLRTGDVGRDERDRLRQDRRPQEGHDPGLRLQRLSERDRGRAGPASGRAGIGGGRRARRKNRRGGEDLRRQEGSEPAPKPR